MRTKVSVIVPIFNSEKYLPQCLDSLLVQTIDGLEIVCVDDGSTDNSHQILEKYKKEDSRLKILKQKHLGVSAARNKAIKAARGEFLAFCDSDDWYPDCESLKMII